MYIQMHLNKRYTFCNRNKRVMKFQAWYFVCGTFPFYNKLLTRLNMNELRSGL